MLRLGLLCIVLISAVRAEYAADSMNKALTDTKTHMYFILSNSTTRAKLIYNFITTLDVAPEHVTIVHATDASSVPMSRFGDFVDAGWVGNWYWKGLVKEGTKKFVEHSEGTAVRGRWALQLSVVRAMEAFVKSPHENMMLFEDDVAMSPDVALEKIISTTINMIRLPANKWDLQYLGWCWECADMDSRSFTSDGPLFTQALFPLCRHSIMYSRLTVQWYLKVWRPPHFLGGDEQLIRLACNYKVKKIRSMEPLFIQSNINAYQDSHLGNTDLKRSFFDWTECGRWKSMCKSLSNGTAQFNLLGETPPDDLDSVTNFFMKRREH